MKITYEIDTLDEPGMAAMQDMAYGMWNVLYEFRKDMFARADSCDDEVSDHARQMLKLLGGMFDAYSVDLDRVP